jgi:hypothetical protein
MRVQDYRGTEPLGASLQQAGQAGERGVDIPPLERVRIHVTVPLEDSGSTSRQLGGVPSLLPPSFASSLPPCLNNKNTLINFETLRAPGLIHTPRRL